MLFVPNRVSDQSTTEGAIQRTRQSNVPTFIQKHAVNWGTVLPIRVMTFVDQFDDCKAVKPFRFQVDIPKKYLRERGVRRNG